MTKLRKIKDDRMVQFSPIRIQQDLKEEIEQAAEKLGWTVSLFRRQSYRMMLHLFHNGKPLDPSAYDGFISGKEKEK